MFDGGAADAHGVRCSIQSVLHGVDHGLIFPALDVGTSYRSR
jgi:hypothetical protein